MKRFLSWYLFAFFTLITHACEIPDNHQLFEDKTILILGGTGYIGRALTTEILKYNPRRIIIFSRDEVKHFEMSKIFKNNPKIHYVIGNIRDYASLLNATRTTDIVIHTAALKRIDMLEKNVEECIKTNIIGALNVFNACVINNVEKVLFISTDKACSPINTYGACKFVSEKIFTNYDTNQIKTKFMVARYGNVLESTGSIIPIFLEKIKKGECLTLTDPQMTRFIMHKNDSIALILNALRYGVGGEIFVKMSTSMRIVDLIDILIEKFNSPNQIDIIGLRPGEKLHETLVNEWEVPRTYIMDDFYIIRSSLTEIYFHEHLKNPIYIQLGKRILNTFSTYSSDQVVMPKADLALFFNRLNIF